MKEFQLKYGCNPNQTQARIFSQDGELPLSVLGGRPGYINFLDALNAYQLVKELSLATTLPCATSFKHVSPTSASVGKILSLNQKKACFVDDIAELDSSLIACAYARARGADRMSSFGDFIALSTQCDSVTARLISREVSDGIIAPSYSQEALKILKAKRNGTYNIIQIDSSYIPNPIERKQVYGITFEQSRNNCVIDRSVLTNIVTSNKALPDFAQIDLLVSLITLKYTQSNSVCFAYDGQAIGVGAGQQSRIHCTRLAGSKADLWQLRQHQKTLDLDFLKGISRADKNNIIDIYLSQEHQAVTGKNNFHKYFATRPDVFTKSQQKEFLSTITNVSLGSDAFFPFGDNIERAKLSGVSFVAQPGGSVKDDNVIAICDKYNMVMAFTGLRLFHH
ncbi:MAG: phosphoribosylaminoimidazolecarboxamide formyltransferase [Clostridia bacterium]